MDTVHFHPRRIDELAAPPPDATARWVWHGYLARGNITVLTGQWKAGKTTLITGLLRHLGDGLPFLGRSCSPSGVAIVSEEDDLHITARQRDIPYGRHVLILNRPFPGNPTPDQWDAFVRRAEDYRASNPLDLPPLDFG